MNAPQMLEVLKQLQAWRNQMIGLGLVLPDLAELAKLVEAPEAAIRLLEREKAALEKEIATLQKSKAQYADQAEAHRTAHEAAMAGLDQERAALEASVVEVRRQTTAALAELHAQRGAATEAQRTELAALQRDIEDSRQALATVRSDFEQFKKTHGLGG